MELSDIVIDPEFQGLIPPLTQQERTALRASLKADGCLTPLIVWHKHRIILDGHNRLEFCRAEDIGCEIVEIVLDSREAAKAWIIKHQLGRRNLNESQRAMLATTLEGIYSKQARPRELAGKGADEMVVAVAATGKTLWQICHTLRNPGGLASRPPQT